MKITENQSIIKYNTFGINHKAKYLVEIETETELIDFFQKKEDNLPILILGGGSNILFTKDFEGYVILLKIKGVEIENIDDNTVNITAASGENWHQFVQYCLKNNYGGLENLSLIPGNVGTSPIQNIGAYGVEIKDKMLYCKVLDIDTLQVKTFDNKYCQFGYRDSIFKKEKGKYCILSVTFQLTRKNHKINTEYGAIRSELESKGIVQPTIHDVSNAVIAIRESKLPDPKTIGNAGSFFKNPTINIDKFSKILTQYPDIPHYILNDKVKIPAGWLIEKAGWKGKKIGNVASHKVQALVITNATGKATGKEIYEFSQKIIDDIKNKFDIELEREVNCL